ncbi:hypothetical protein D3C73_811740 [compost metagenome]
MEVIHQVTVDVSVGVSQLGFPRQILTLERQQLSPIVVVSVAIDLDHVHVFVRTFRRKEGVGVNPEEQRVVVQATKDLVTLDGDNDVAIPHYL